MKVAIVGDGVFGTFLKKELAAHCKIVGYDDADYAILAVPVSAYDEAACEWQHKHLVNICSVQTEADRICKIYNPRKMTSIHPMFGPNSPKEGRTCIVTHKTTSSDRDLSLFENLHNTLNKNRGGYDRQLVKMMDEVASTTELHRAKTGRSETEQPRTQPVSETTKLIHILRHVLGGDAQPTVYYTGRGEHRASN